MKMSIHTNSGLRLIFVALINVLPIYCRICLTWDIFNNHMKLNCKTENLRFNVRFLDPLKRERAFCFVSIPKSICKVHDIDGEITQDTLTNETVLTIPLLNDNNNSVWTCRHGHNYEETTVEVKPKHKQAIIAPEIRANQTWPFEDGSVVEFTCIALIYDKTATLSWNCINIEASKQFVVNCTQYNSKLIYTASIEDNGRVCKCIVKMHDDSSSTSVKFDIRTKFTLDIQHQFQCNRSDEVKLSCMINGNASSFGFDSWIHTYKGVFIRHLKGSDVGVQSAITINSCQFSDCGEYACRAWMMEKGRLKWIQKAGELSVRGRPIIVETKTFSYPVLICTAKFISIPTAYFIEWYTSDDVLNNSSKYNQTLTEEIITVLMYGVPVAVSGYKVTITTESEKEIETNEHISLVLMNEFGKSSWVFNLWTDREVFNLQIVQWTLVGVAVLIITSTTTLLLARQNRKRKQQLDHLNHLNIYYAAPIVEIEPNIYQEILSINEDVENHCHHQLADVAISLDNTKTNTCTQDNYSNESQHYMYLE